MDVISSLYTKVYALDWYEYGCKVHEFGYPSCVAIFNSKNVVHACVVELVVYTSIRN